MKYLALICIFIFSSAPFVSAAPDDVERVQRLGDEAEKAHRYGRFEDAVELYKDAYAISQSPPEILYNIGVIYEKELRDFDMAIAFFERFLDEPNIDADAALKAQARLRRLQEIHRNVPVSTVIEHPQSSVGAWWLVGLGGVTTAAGLTLGGVAWHNSQVFKDSRDADEKRDIKARGNTSSHGRCFDWCGRLDFDRWLSGMLMDAKSEQRERTQSKGNLYLSPSAFGWSLEW